MHIDLVQVHVRRTCYARNEPKGYSMVDIIRQKLIDRSVSGRELYRLPAMMYAFMAETLGSDVDDQTMNNLTEPGRISWT